MWLFFVSFAKHKCLCCCSLHSISHRVEFVIPSFLFSHQQKTNCTWFAISLEIFRNYDDWSKFYWRFLHEILTLNCRLKWENFSSWLCVCVCVWYFFYHLNEQEKINFNILTFAIDHLFFTLSLSSPHSSFLPAQQLENRTKGKQLIFV